MKILVLYPKRYIVLVLSLIAMFFTQQVFSQSQTFNSSGTYTVPTGVTSIVVEAWGGGGAGGGSTNAGTLTARGGGGGGGGAFASTILTLLPGTTTLNIVVAGQKSGTSGATGGNGDPSTITGFESLILAAGGTGGTGNTAGGSPAGGAGGTVAASAGSTRTAGAAGGNGATGIGISSGAGGTGANSGGGGGSAITSGSSDGNNGIAPGGGGGGSRTSQNDGNRTGGPGAAGRVIITACPFASVSYTGTPFCKSLTSASVTFTGSLGGTFSASPAGLTINASTGLINPSTSTAATYTVHYQIAGASGCPAVDATAPVTINALPVSSATGTNITCFSANDGTITVSANGGTSPYMFSVDNGANFQAAGLFTGLLPNTPYTIKVKDSNGCVSK